MECRTLAFIILISICYAFEDECQEAGLKAVLDKCEAIYGFGKNFSVDWALLKDAIDDDGKCFRACVYKECNYINGEGKFNDNSTIRGAHILNGGDEHKVGLIVEATRICLIIVQPGENICDYAENYSRCLIQQCDHCGLQVYNVLEGIGVTRNLK